MTQTGPTDQYAADLFFPNRHAHLIDRFFLRVELVLVGIQTISVITCKDLLT